MEYKCPSTKIRDLSKGVKCMYYYLTTIISASLPARKIIVLQRNEIYSVYTECFGAQEVDIFFYE
jgi:hypothetical protein